MQPLLKLGPCCYEKETYSQYRMRMHYVTGYLGTHFIRILSVQKKLLKKKSKKLKRKTGPWNWAARRGGLRAFVVIIVVQSLSRIQLFVTP